MKSSDFGPIAIIAVLAVLAAERQSPAAEDYGDGFGNPRPPGTGLTVDNSGKTTLMCGWISLDLTSTWGFNSNYSKMRLWIDREPVVNFAELSNGLHAVVIEIPKAATPLVFRWTRPNNVVEVIPAAVLYPVTGTVKPGCSIPQPVRPAAPVLRAPL